MANLLPALVEASRNQQEAVLRGSESLGNFLRERRFNQLGRDFFTYGDYSPEGIQKFAKSRGASPAEMGGLLKTLSAMEQYQNERDPMVTVQGVAEDGVTPISRRVRQSEIMGREIQTGATPMEKYVDPAGNIQLVPSNTAPGSGYTSESIWANRNSSNTQRDLTADEIKARAANLNTELSSRERVSDKQIQAEKDIWNIRKSTPTPEDVARVTNQQRKSENDIAASLGFGKDGYFDPKTGTAITDKVELYNYWMKNGTNEQKGRAMMGLKLFNSINGLDQNDTGGVTGKPRTFVINGQPTEITEQEIQATLDKYPNLTRQQIEDALTKRYSQGD